MPRPKSKVPGYCRHKASGRAVVRLDGKDHYLGAFGSPESHEAIAKWQASGRERSHAGTSRPLSAAEKANLTVAEVLLRYRDFARTYYIRDGQPTKQFVNLQYAMKPLRLLFGDVPAAQFDPLNLKTVRECMVSDDVSRNEINKRINMIKRFWKWAASEKIVPVEVYQGVATLEPLQFGRTEARETEDVTLVDDKWIDATLPYMSRQVAAMTQVQRLTGVRPAEIAQIHAREIDRSETIWFYRPKRHKHNWRGQSRDVPLGPKAQALLTPFLEQNPGNNLFSPRQAEEDRNARRRDQRKSPMTPSQLKRRPKASPAHQKRDHYDTDSYRRAVKYAIKKANRTRAANEQIPDWFPLQIRHTRATEVRKKFGLEASQVSLGHSHADVTQVYAERNLELAVKVAEAIG